MATKKVTYQTIDRPYDSLLQRSAGDLKNVSSQDPSTSSQIPKDFETAGDTSTSGGTSATGAIPNNGSLETMPTKSDGSIGDLWIDTFIASKNWKPKKIGFYIDGQTGYAEFTDVFVSGEIESISGLIGGFTISGDTLSATDGTNTTALSSGTNAFIAGPTGNPSVIITQNGSFTASNATITGVITALSGAIGGFSLTPTKLTAGSNSTTIELSTEEGIHLGATNFNDAPFRVTLGGNLFSATGLIGGWTISDTTLSSQGMVFDSANRKIKVGTASEIVIDGATKSIKSSNYVSGINGAGFSLDSNLLEVGNISARGLIRTAVFQKDVVSTVGGNLAVLPGDILDVDMTALDAETITTKGDVLLRVGDVLRIKDGTDDEWFKVTSIAGAPTYVVERDKAALYASNNNPTWKKGASVIVYGINGDGGVYMTASENDAPYISIFDHTGSPWTTINTRLRLGNLNGYLGYTTDTYGIAIGETDSYFKYDPVNGIDMKGNISIGAGHSIRGGQTDYATGDGFFLGDSSGIYKFSIGSTTNYLTWDGTYLKLKGSFDVGVGGIINNGLYTVANLPVPATVVGFNNPSALA